jgi:mono/diheme cytochrome c family protein
MTNRLIRLVPASSRSFVRWFLCAVLVLAVPVLMVGCGGSSKPSDESASAPAPSPTAESPAAPATDTPTGETGVSGSDALALGAKVYAARCALCHGAGGNGDGPAAAGLNPKPRAHTDKAYMSTLTDEQILAVIRNGKVTMPAWGKVLSEAELVAVAAHVRSLAK